MRQNNLWILIIVLAVVSPAAAQTVHQIGPCEGGEFPLVTGTVKVFDNGVQNQSNWEPYTGAFRDGTLVLVTNTEADGDLVGLSERGVVAFFSPGGTISEEPGFFTDAGEPWTVNNDVNRIDGNMPRIAPSAKSNLYMFGNECTPWVYPDSFPNYSSGFAYDAQVASVQILEKTEAGPLPVTNVFDPTYGSWTTGAQNGQQIRFGGSIGALSNGNFIAIQEDRTGNLHPNHLRCAAASIWDPEGINVPSNFFSPAVPAWCAMTPPSLPPDPEDAWPSVGIWDSLACYDTGFAIRNNGAGVDFFNNDGSYVGRWEANSRQADEPWSWPLPNGRNTSVASWSGSNERICSNTDLDYIYLVGRGYSEAGGGQEGVFVTKIGKDLTTKGEVYVSMGYSVDPDRCECCTDRHGRFFVCWSDSSNTRNKQIIGRLYDEDLNPGSDLFLVFMESEVGHESVTGFSAKHPSCAMSSWGNSGGWYPEVLVTARVDGPAPSLGLDTNDSIATVFSRHSLLCSFHRCNWENCRCVCPTDTPIPTATATETPLPTPSPTQTPSPRPTFVNDRSDIDGSQTVDWDDLLQLLRDWGKGEGED